MWELMILQNFEASLHWYIIAPYWNFQIDGIIRELRKNIILYRERMEK